MSGFGATTNRNYNFIIYYNFYGHADLYTRAKIARKTGQGLL